MNDLENGIQKIVDRTVQQSIPKTKDVLTRREAINLIKKYSSREYLKKGEAANYLGVSATTFWRWRINPENKIHSYTIDGMTLYKKSDLDDFYERKAIKSYI